MKVYLAYIWERITNAFWIIPCIVALGIISTLILTVNLEIPDQYQWMEKLISFKTNPEGARTILGSIATASMTVVGVLFSITIVVLQQASTQYTPRVVQNFVRSKTSQIVLGFFIGTFIYCLLLLTNIQPKPGAATEFSVPQISLSFSIILALVCMLLLITYIQHITKSIQSTEIISTITKETIRTLKNIIQDREENNVDDKESEEINLDYEYVILSQDHGYFQKLDWKSLAKLHKDETWTLDVIRDLGDFLHLGDELYKLKTEREWTEDERLEFLECFTIGETRTNAQDPKFGVRKLVDISLRALSPGINDPSTAEEAINGITSVMLVYSEHYPIPHSVPLSKRRYITLPENKAEEYLSVAYDQLLQFGEDHLPVKKHIHRDLKKLLHRSESDEVKEAAGKRIPWVTEHWSQRAISRNEASRVQ